LEEGKYDKVGHITPMRNPNKEQETRQEGTNEEFPAMQ
jgi:hypothetical protein